MKKNTLRINFCLFYYYYKNKKGIFFLLKFRIEITFTHLVEKDNDPIYIAFTYLIQLNFHILIMVLYHHILQIYCRLVKGMLIQENLVNH